MAIHNKLTEEEIDYIIVNHDRYTCAEFSKQLNRNKQTIGRVLRDRGLLAKRPDVHNKVKFNYNFFSDINPISAYWAGFIAADGCINERNCLSMGLSSKDSEHLSLFLKDINYPLHIRGYTYNGFDISSTSIINKQVVSDLLNIYNITPRKSLSLRPPTNLPDNIKKYFIAGYFDGDGCFVICDGKKNGSITPILHCSIIGTYEMLSWIKEEFNIIYNRNIKIGCIQKLKSKNNQTYVLSLCTKSAIAFGDWIYCDSTRYLDRKYKKYKKVKELRPIKQRNFPKGDNDADISTI